MEETIAELRRQLEEERQAREEAERRQGEAERHVQPNTLFTLLDRCHNYLSQAIRVETDATLTTQGDATNPVNRLYPKRIVPWLDFPQLQEQVWRKLDRTAALTSRPLFPSDTQIDYVFANIQNRPIYSEASFEISSETRWIILLKWLSRRCEMMKSFDMSLESKVKSPLRPHEPIGNFATEQLRANESSGRANTPTIREH
ncbi:hypothetical protein PDIDSM_7553 [Penicillium digitatum]|nr:hypothetical protein PDIDSM_7553 [Penicillium digitatum]